MFLNLIACCGEPKADYLLIGSWLKKSFKEAFKYGDVVIAASSDGVWEDQGRLW